MATDTENPADHTLAVLREMREGLRDFRKSMDAFRKETTDSFVRVEVRLSGIEQTTGALLSTYGVQNERIDSIDERLRRVERRLELAD